MTADALAVRLVLLETIHDVEGGHGLAAVLLADRCVDFFPERPETIALGSLLGLLRPFRVVEGEFSQPSGDPLRDLPADHAAVQFRLADDVLEGLPRLTLGV